MDSQFFTNKLAQVSQHLGPFRERLEAASRTAPTEELRKIASDLLQSLTKSYDESVAEIHNMVKLYADENGKVEQATRDLDAIKAAAIQRQGEAAAAAAAASAPTARPTLAFNPAVLEQLKRQLIEHVGIVEPRVPRHDAAGGGQHFADWVQESLASNAAADSKSPEVSGPNVSTSKSPTKPVSRFDSWLNESIQSVGAFSTAAPIPKPKSDAESDQREWEKMLGH